MSGAEVLIPISFFATIGLVFISRSEIGKAIAHAIRVNATDADEEGLAQLGQEVSDLRRELDEMRGQLADTQERLDFAERLLAQARSPEQLPRG